jgi:hypothetical protein
MLHEEGLLAELPCPECPTALPEAGYQLLAVFNRAASYESYKKDGVEKRYVSMDWALVSLLLEETDDRAQMIRDLADLRHDLNSS